MIKYHIGSFQCAKKAGLLREYLFWLQLKNLPSHGRILNRHVIKTISQVTQYSNATISLLIKKSTECGFTHQLWDDKGLYAYHISSYKEVMSRIKYRHKSEHKIIKVQNINNPKAFKCFIQSLEIENNFKKQDFKEKQKLQRRIDYNVKKNNLDKVDYLKSKLDGIGIDLQLQRESIQISCKKISKILGYKTVSFSSKLEKRMNKLGFCEIFKRGINFICCMKKSEWLFSPIRLSSFWTYGKVFSYSCNKIFFSLCTQKIYSLNGQDHSINK